MLTGSNLTAATPQLRLSERKNAVKSVFLTLLMVLSSLASIEYLAIDVQAASDQDGDGLTYGLEYLMNTQPNDPDSDNDGLPDGWEWKYGLDPLSSSGADGAVADPDGDGMSNLQEYTYLMPNGWDNPSTGSVLDNGVWWNGTIPVNDWNEENSMQYNQPACGAAGSDGTGSIILCDEDPVGNICTNGFDDDKDGFVDAADPDNDGDADCLSDDDDGDGLIDEDPAGWDTDGDGMNDGWEAANNLNATSPSNADGPNGDPDGDGLTNLMEYVNPTWTTMCGSSPCFRNGPDGAVTETTSPCDPVQGVGPGACATYTAEVDGITSTNPQIADTDGDGLNDSYEALTLLTDPTAADTDGDGIRDGVEVNGAYGNPAQASDPRDNNTDDDAFDDGEEDTNFNGLVDEGETDPTRREDAGDEDNDGIQNWEENLSCTLWNVADTDFGGVSDGDERNISHGTDPCDSLVNFETTFVSYDSSSNQVTLGSGSGFNPGGGVGWYNVSGSWESFAYATIVNTVLQGVSNGPSATPSQVANRNGSFCHTDAVAAGTIGSTQQYCDDDYTDSDQDGLADWQELLGTFGWFSNPNIADSDADGVDDFGEVSDNTDPNEPCANLLDTDGDGLNNYFENNTGCDLNFIGITNGSQDIWVTDYASFDTDQGGVNDRTEYYDGTNPQNDPSDDVQPDDFDGDGVPDAIENQTGTDWTNPDTDGGGLLDGIECPDLYWVANCAGSPFDPFDPTDDILNNDVLFWANNSSGVVDVNSVHRWRVNTNDFYTGSTYAQLDSVHPKEAVSIPYSNLTHLAPLSFANDTIEWTINYNNPINVGQVPVPSFYSNISYVFEAIATFSRNNDTHTVTVDQGPINELWFQEPEYYFDWATLASTTVPGQGFPYELLTDEIFINTSDVHSYVFNVTNGVVTDSGATDAYSVALALEEFLTNGNSSTEFKRNYNGSGTPSILDTTLNILETRKEGSCREFNTLFVTMARLAGLPARQVTGYSGGTWTGEGYAVYAADATTWSEVRLQQNNANGNTDLGWIAFDPCPPAEEMEVVNQTISTLTWSRDSTQDINVTGQLRYAENGTPASEVPVFAYLVPVSEANLVPGPGGPMERLISEGRTDANGTFNFTGVPDAPTAPGMHNIVVEYRQFGYVPNGGAIYDSYVNMTENSTLFHTAPAVINAPVAGAGATTVIEGLLEFENQPLDVFFQLPDQTVWLTYTSSVDGAQNLTGLVDSAGAFTFTLNLSEFETKGNLSATLGYSGWQDTSVTGIPLEAFHLNPTTTSIVLNVTDAPNLTAIIEGPLTNKSILLLDDNIWVNGSAVSVGAAPVPLTGTLQFSIRGNNSGDVWFEVFNTSVTGTFSIQHFLPSSTMVGSGELEVRLRFFPASLPATDDANMSTSVPYFLRGFLGFQVGESAQMRGFDGTVEVSITDHRGFVQDLVLLGDYDFSFDGTWYNTTTDPTGDVVEFSWPLAADLVANDYPIDISFNGSDYYQPSIGNGSIRVQAEIGYNLSIGQDWTHIGNSTFLSGDIFDAFYNTPVLNNNTQIRVTINLEDGPVDIAQSSLNNSTGAFNIPITMPTTIGSGVYDFVVEFDFESQAPLGGAYYSYLDTSLPPSPPTLVSVLGGIESEVVVTAERPNYIIEMNNTVDLIAKITDLADGSNVSGASVEYIWDYGVSNTSLGTVSSDADGNATFSFTPSSIAPGYYDLMVIIQDDISSSLTAGNTRYLGNSTLLNITIQVTSDIQFNNVPTTITAGTPFNVVGQVLDAENSSRPLISAVRLNVFWLEYPDELLLNGFSTTNNGSFNMSVPTDTANNGTQRGPHTLVISVVNESSPFYLTATAQTPIQVMGVSRLENLVPLNAVVINRGNTVNMSAKLVEASDLFAPLAGYDVGLEFHETWLTSATTDGEGFANFSYTVPYDHPLGLIVVQMVYNGSSDLLSTSANLTSITVRSLTFMVVDSITDNPVAGDEFNISGRVTSDNGSGLTQRDNITLPNANVLFSIDGVPTGFTVTGGAIGTGGFWNASLRLTETFGAGTHVLEATYLPNVNYYVGSENNTTFDSRGFSTLDFILPSLDGLGQPSLNDRTDRGTNVSFQVLLRDNQGEAMGNQSLTVSLPGTNVSGVFVTAPNGSAFGTLLVPYDSSVGPADIRASFVGISGTTGIIGSNGTTLFVVLAATNLTIADAPTVLTAGDSLTVSGTLLDDLGMPLVEAGAPATAVVHLTIDGVPVASIETNATDGSYTLGYTLPEDTAAGPHVIGVEFRGGRDWVDPVGYGDIVNPEYYLPSSETVGFNVSVPTEIIFLTPTGQADRESTMTLEGQLVDLVDNSLPNLTIGIWLDGEWLTNTTTDENGYFIAVHPVPADAQLGPLSVEIRFTGTVAYLPSNATGVWEIFSPILVTVDMTSPVAVNETVTVSGTVVDNQLLGIAGHEVQLVVEGIVITSITTDENGAFSYDWFVPDIFAFGNHTLEADVASQGYYRSGTGNVTFFLSHRSWVTLLFEDGIEATRGDSWEVNGRLYDYDTVEREGLVGMMVDISMDGVPLFSTVTGADGLWSASIPATMDLARGEHTLSVSFEGTTAHLAASTNSNLMVWSDVIITLDPTSTSIVTRSDDVFAPIVYTGSVQEVGGEGEVFEDLVLTIGNGSECANGREGAQCFRTVLITWANGNFSVTATAPYWLDVGSQYFAVDSARNDSNHLNAGTVSKAVFVQVDANIVPTIGAIVEGVQEEIDIEVLITAKDTKNGIPGIDVVVYLYDENNSQIASQQRQTDNSGVVQFDFPADPPYGDYSFWGEVTMDIVINDPRISSQSTQDFEALRSEGFELKYSYAAEESTVSPWAYVMVLLLGALIAGGVVLYRRKVASDDLLKDAAEVFAYTAELLAAGDAVRESIFTCYQDLCGLLQQRGFLRRDFETVREFEFAIRQALHGVSDDALTALDNTFEMARYSREEMGSQHQEVAVQSLTRMGTEIEQIQKFPQR